VSWFPILLVVHIALAVALLAPSILLPFLLRRAAATGAQSNPVLRALMAMQGSGSVVIALGVGLTGVGLLATLGLELLSRPWLLVALVIYAANLLLAAFVARPNLRRLLRIGGAGDGGDEMWRRRARQQRYVAYAMAAAIGVIGFLMSTKPELW
jgi:Predicted integral membrane protein (DUF2269)